MSDKMLSMPQDNSVTSRKPFPVYGSILTALAGFILSGCGRSLNTETIAQTIQDDVIKQGGVSLKSVTCPRNVKLEAESTFECIGTIDTGYTFTIPVKQKDAQGTVTWDVPNTKGLLNVAKFETLIQEAVQGEIGSRPIINCGDGFKPIKPGQVFECKITVKEKPNPKTTKDPKTPDRPAPPKSAQSRQPGTKGNQPAKPDLIVVAVAPDGNVSWQRVMPGGVSQLLPKPAQKPQSAPEQTAATTDQAPATKPETPTPASPTAPPPPAQQSADDFLNQAGAFDDF
jgi:hypothetical protein